ncbi:MULTISPECIES: MarR family winged helix-turn-helix transcriptional regulator [unclassified Ensifer]|uniref:MarR family winged helix-turn-helix transcriptional regulator n=1 Tax=unclassified Ensifer TaxID=2633371 RepID=UPI000712F517|nr:MULTISPECIES: MarR family transcriptional regulator [unclassified Ensifer]KQX57556.1 MarR family transcriptional regulator [Ensifer sp. Root1298]KQX92719.1 MarR family transcriptional regulator [Ensifer sp. Root1312]KRC28486.1 MarR family transcriptional regulator [Ensifer sp. Root74]KRD78633.1 MarR family transcriptional regulator [Ensifer sp. Root954]
MAADGFELNAFLPYRLNRAAEFVALRFAAQYKARYQLTRPEWRTLAALGSTNRPMTATEVGAHSAMHKTKVSRAVALLEKRRWLTRREDENDRRIEHLELTKTGIRAYGELTELAVRYQAELDTLIGPAGIQALAVGLEAVERAIGRFDPPPSA